MYYEGPQQVELARWDFEKQEKCTGTMGEKEARTTRKEGKEGKEEEEETKVKSA